MKKFLTLLIAICTCYSQKSFAQVSYYGFSQTNTTYTPITGGSVIGLPYETYTGYGNIPIGFNFVFNGVTHTELGMSTAGYLVMGGASSAMVSGDYFILEDIPANVNDNVIAGYNDDFEMGYLTTCDYLQGSNQVTNVGNISGIKVGDGVDYIGNFAPFGTVVTAVNTAANSFTMSNPAITTGYGDVLQMANGEMRVQVIGTAPNRIFVAQWKNAHTYGESNESINFQIRLHETTNRVQVVYGNMQKSNLPWEVQVGLSGNSRLDFNTRTAQTSWVTTSAGSHNSSMKVSSANKPATGLTYNWDICVPSGAPTLTSNVTNNTFCAAQLINLTVTSSNLNGGANWAWHTNSCTGSQIAVGNSITVNAQTQNKTYYVKAIGGCNPANGGPCTPITLNYMAPPTVTASASGTAICSGTPVTLNGSGANTYSWTGGALNGMPTIINNTTIYTVTGTTTNNCTNTATIEITAITSPTISVSATPASGQICLGATANLNATGAPTIAWSNSVNNNVPFSPTTPNTYTVTGTGANGCTSTNTFIIDVQQVPTLTVTTQPLVLNFCLGGSILLNASGAPNISWNNGYINNTTVVPTGNTTYVVTGSTSAGCSTSTSITASVLPNPTVSALSLPASANVCVNTSVALYGSGASSYTWTGGITNNISFPATATNIYTVTGTGSNGCTATSTINLVANPVPVITIVSIPTSANPCSGSNMTLTASGGTNVSWSGSIFNGLNFTPYVTTVYTATVSNGNCSATKTQLVTVKNLPNVGITYSPSNVICLGQSVTVTLTGGVSYLFGGGIQNNVPFIPNADVNTTGTGFSSNGCAKTVNIGITVLTPPTVTITPTPNNSAGFCTNSQVSLNAALVNGTATWSGGISNNVPFNVSATNVYTVTALGTNGCSTTTPYTVTALATPTLNVSVAPSNSVCAGASVTVNTTGADTILYTGGINNNVSFIPASNNVYTVTGTNVNNCSTTATFNVGVIGVSNYTVAASPSTNLCVGSMVTLNAQNLTNPVWSGGVSNGVAFATPIGTTIYTVSGITSGGCNVTNTIQIVGNALPTISATIAPSNVICAGGTVTLNALSNGTIVWSNNITNNTSIAPTQNTTYTATATSALGCKTTTTLAVTINALPILTLTTSPANLTVCMGGLINLKFAGANNITWGGKTVVDTTFAGALNNIGTYTVIGTNSNGCSTTASFNITVNSLPTISATTSTNNTTICENGSIALIASSTGANAATSFAWSNSVVNNVPFTASISNVYTVTGTNANGCTTTSTLSLNVLPAPAYTLSGITYPTDTLCVYDNFQFDIYAPTAASIAWSNGYTNSSTLEADVSGDYTYTVTAANGCQVISTTHLEVRPYIPYTTVIPDGSEFCGPQTVTLNAIVAPHIKARWRIGGSINVPNNYTFTLSNSESFLLILKDTITGCEQYFFYGLLIINYPTIKLVGIQDSTANVCGTGAITFTGQGNANYTYSGNITNNVPFTPPQGTSVYTVTATIGGQSGTLSCTNTKLFIVNASPIPVVSVTNNINYVCQNNPYTQTATSSIPATFTMFGYSNPPTNPQVGVPFTWPNTGNYVYTITATSATGCTGTKSIGISVSPATYPTLTTPINLNSGGVCINNSVYVSGNGGVSYITTPTLNVNGYNTFTNTVNTYTVTAIGGGSCNGTTVITLNIGGKPSISVYRNPSSGAVCAGSTVTISASSTTANCTFNWTGGIQNGVPFVLNQYNVYTVTAVSPLGCTSTTIAPFGVNVGAITLSSNPTNGEICPGKFFSLNVYNFAGGYTITPSVAVNTALPAPTAPITYTLSAISAINGCPGLATKQITPLTAPTLNTAFAPTANICQGAATMTVTTSGGTNITYAPSNFTSGVGFATNNISNNTTYTVTGTGANGCTNTATFRLSNVQPIPNFIVAGPGTYCPGLFVKLVGIPANLTYAYNPPYVNNTTYQFANTTTYTVTATNPANGCSKTGLAAMIAKPAVTFSVVGSADTLCPGSNNLCTIIPSSAGSHSLYVNNVLINNNINTPGTYTFNTNSTLGNSFITMPIKLTNASTTCSSTSNIYWFNQVTPFISLTPNNVTVSLGSPVTLNATGNCNTYNWTGGVTNNVSFVPNATATYTVTGSHVNGCTTASTAVVTVIVPKPIGNSKYEISTLVILPNSNMNELQWTMKNNYLDVASLEIEKANNLNEAFSVIGKIEYKNGNYIGNNYQYSFVDMEANTNSFYRVRAIDANGTVLAISNMVNNLGDFLLNAYPNPTTNACNIEVKTVTEMNVTLNVIDMNGSIKKRINATINPTSNNVYLDFGNLPTGTYQVQVLNGNNVLGTSKIIKQ